MRLAPTLFVVIIVASSSMAAPRCLGSSIRMRGLTSHMYFVSDHPVDLIIHFEAKKFLSVSEISPTCIDLLQHSNFFF